MKPRAFIDVDLQVGATVPVKGDAFRHICKVLRARPGDRIILFNGRGGEFIAQLDFIEKHQAFASIESHDPVDRAPALHWELLQAISKGDRMDYTLQKSTELGVGRIMPFIAERSVVKLDTARAEKRRQHWLGVVRNAAEQCGMNRIPDIAPIGNLNNAMNHAQGTTQLLLDPEADTAIGDVALRGSVALLIGPEGGLTEDEIRLAVDAGYQAVRMGPRTLRTETAAVVAAAVLLEKAGDLA
jgi:16S rRNA (uracil1498-N3)-methyltransferase